MSNNNADNDSDDNDDNVGGKDDWCLIESDPGVFTELLESLGCPHVELQELWSLEDDALLLEKVYGLIFLFQWTKDGQSSHARLALDVDDVQQQHSLLLPDGMWFGKQVTTNACATQAILSILLNATGEVGNESLELGKTLAEFREFTKDFNAQLKGVSIAGSEELRAAHNAFASPETLFDDGNTPKPHNTKNAEAFHFVAYIPYQGTVYELDGLMPGPIAVGDIVDTVSWIATAKEAIQTRMNVLPTEKFNLMAVIQDKRINAAANNTEDLDIEQQKRNVWKLENERRRHNYIPLVGQLLQELARAEKGKLTTLTNAAVARKKTRLAAKAAAKQQNTSTSATKGSADDGESKQEEEEEEEATMEE
jgi:ubiquitin carboxyl-terminal hydrolase L5